MDCESPAVPADIKVEENDDINQKLITTPLKRDPYLLRSRDTTANVSIAHLLLSAMEEPLKFDDVKNSTHAKQWKQAMNDEMESLKRNETWKLVSLPEHENAISNKWVFKIKSKPDGTPDRLKARLVVKACSQIPGKDYSETFTPVVRYESVRTLLTIAAVEDSEIIQIDVKTAFLNGDIEEEMYMCQPEGYHDGRNNVCLLKKVSMD